MEALHSLGEALWSKINYRWQMTNLTSSQISPNIRQCAKQNDKIYMAEVPSFAFIYDSNLS